MKSFRSVPLAIGVILLIVAGHRAVASAPIPPIIQDAEVRGLSGLLQDSEGWTILKQFLATTGSHAGTSPDGDQLSRLVYVSASGNDAAAAKNARGRGYYVPSDPEIGGDPAQPTGPIKAYATFAAAIKAVRLNGDTRRGNVTRYPDWVLFERGGQYDLAGVPVTISVAQGGPTPERRRVYAAYGNPLHARPVITSSKPLAGTIWAWGDRGGANIAVMSLDFSGINGPGLRLQQGASDVLVEDSAFRSMGMAQSESTNIILRRNVAAGAFNNDSHVQGLYIHSVGNILVEQNVFDMNGYKEDPFDPASWTASINSQLKTGEMPVGTGVQPTRTWFDRNLYLSSYKNLRLVRNIISRGGGGGSVQMRVGGSAEANVFLFNHIALIVGHRQADRSKLQDARVEKNLVLHDDVLLSPGGIGGGLMVGVGNKQRADVTDNIVAHFHDRKPRGSAMIGIGGIQYYGDKPAQQAQEIHVRNNAIAATRSTPLWINSPVDADGVMKAVVESNSISRPAGSGAEIMGKAVTTGLFVGAKQGAGNQYFAPGWSQYSAWKALGLDKFSTRYSSQAQLASASGWGYPSENSGAGGWNRDIVSYMQAIDPAYRVDEQVTVDSGVPADKRRPQAQKLVDVLVASGMPLESARTAAARYHAFLVFIDRARANRKGQWNFQYTSDALNNYIRDGFGKELLNPSATNSMSNTAQ